MIAPQQSTLPHYYEAQPGSFDYHTPAGPRNTQRATRGIGERWVDMPEGYRMLYTAGSLAGTVGGVIHGYKRNNGSVGWAIVWGLLGGAFWPFVLPIAYVQGFGEPK